MDKFKLEFKTSGAAFDAGVGGDPEYETVKILNDVIRRIEQGLTKAFVSDSNGNVIGEWSLS